MKIAITARDFTKPDTRAIDLLRQSGHEVQDYSDLGLGTGTSEADMVRCTANAEIVVAGLEPFSEDILRQCPKLKMISKRSIGYDSVDLDACRRYGVAVARATGTVEAAVAEHVMAYILYFAREMDKQNRQLHAGQWNRFMTYGAKNRTLGLVGFGGIGKEIAKRAVPFGMEVLYYCRHPHPEWEAEYHVRACTLDELLQMSDYISINVPLSDSTRGMFGEAEFAKMKPECVFLNIARAPIVDTAALKHALDTGRIRGAGVDVYEHEPCTDSILCSCSNAVLTPHTASFTSENFSEMNLRAAQNVLDFLDGTLEEKYRLA